SMGPGSRTSPSPRTSPSGPRKAKTTGPSSAGPVVVVVPGAAVVVGAAGGAVVPVVTGPAPEQAARRTTSAATRLTSRRTYPRGGWFPRASDSRGLAPPKMPIVGTIHQAWGPIAAGISGVVGLWGVLMARKQTPPKAFYWAVGVAVAGLLVQVLLGV